MFTDQLCLAHQLLLQGLVTETEYLLAEATTDETSQNSEIAYLLVWSTMERGLWEEVLKLVSAPPFVDEADALPAWLVEGSVRRRRPVALLKLAAFARSLGYPEEAVGHLQHCLRLLDERRMNIPAARLQAHVALGEIALASGDGATALKEYEAALSLCAEDPGSPNLSTLYAGLCEAYQQQKLFTQAQEVGQKALPGLSGAYQEALCLRLSRISVALRDFAQAHAYVQQARTVACEADDPTRIAMALYERTRVFFEEGKLTAARLAGEEAWRMQQHSEDAQLRGQIALLCGTLAEAEWRNSQDPGMATLASSWYTCAQAATGALEPSNALCAEVVVRQAQFCEAKGEIEEALGSWKQAYQLREALP